MPVKWSVGSFKGAVPMEDDMERPPDMKPEQDPNVVSNPDRLLGAKGLKYLKERST